MLKIFDFNKNPIGYIWKYKDLKKESDLSTADKTLSFTYLARTHEMKEEYYVQDKEDEYVIKEVNLSSDGFPQIVAKLNLEELEGKPWEKFSFNSTITEAASLALTGTGWRVGECNVTKVRSGGVLNADTLTIMDKLCAVFMCEKIYDTKNKTVSFYEQVGEDKGVYFLQSLNLKKISEKSDTYDYYTRIQPVGKDGLGIADINDGKNYLENYQYTNKVKTYLWIDESYEDAEALKEDAEKKLDDMSRPLKSYSAEIRDLAKRKQEYSILSFGIGDTVTLIDKMNGIREKQRIVKMTEYPQDPDKNTCELSNTVLTFEELQQKLKEATDIINTVVTSEGQFTGTVDIDDILHFEDGVTNSEAVTGLRQQQLAVDGELTAVKATIGQIETNYIKAEEADIKYATIEELNVTNETVHTISGDYADFKVATADEFSAQTALIENISGDLASYKTVMANELTTAKGWMLESSIGDAQISSLSANKLTAGTIDTAIVTVSGSDGRLQIADNTIQIKDSKHVRVQMGKDGSGDYTLAVWDANGNLIWDALGATDNTIQRKIIRDSIVADNANIQGYKLDIDSVVTSINGATTTISGTKVQVGDKTLTVALSEQSQTITSNYTALQGYADTAKATAISTAASDATTKANSALSSAKSYADSAVDNLEIGGRNLLLKTNQGTTNWYASKANGTFTVSAYEEFGVQINCSIASTSWQVLRYIFDKSQVDLLEPNSEYVISFDIKTDMDITGAFISIRQGNGTNALIDDRGIIFNNNDTWQHISTVLTTNDLTNSHSDQVVYILGFNKVGNVYFKNLKLEKGNKATDWTPAPEDTEAQFETVTAGLTKAQQDLLTQAGLINNQGQLIAGNTATIESHTETLSTHSAEIKATQDSIALKVSTQEYESYKTTVTGQIATAKSEAVSTAANDATTKANSALSSAKDYTTAQITTVNSHLSTIDTSITTMQGQIALKVEQTDIDTAVSNVQIGGRNLLIGSSTASTNNWYAFGWGGSFKTASVKDRTYAFNTVNGWRDVIYDMTNYVGQDITISCDVKLLSSSTNTSDIMIYTTHRSNNTKTGTCVRTKQLILSKKDVWIHYENSFTLTLPYLGFYVRGVDSDASTGSTTVYFKNVKFEKGNKATDWTPAPEDTETAITTISQKQAEILQDLSSITSRVSATESTQTTQGSSITSLTTRMSTAEQKITKDGIVATVGSYYATDSDLTAAEKRITTAESTISQHTTEIALTVKKSGVISAINQTAETIKISASKLNLDGYITATNLKNDGATTISGGKLTCTNINATGTITTTGTRADGLTNKASVASGAVTMYLNDTQAGRLDSGVYNNVKGVGLVTYNNGYVGLGYISGNTSYISYYVNGGGNINGYTERNIFNDTARFCSNIYLNGAIYYDNGTYLNDLNGGGLYCSGRFNTAGKLSVGNVDYGYTLNVEGDGYVKNDFVTGGYVQANNGYHLSTGDYLGIVSGNIPGWYCNTNFTSAGTLVSTAANGLVISGSGHNAIFRVDANKFYILCNNSGTIDGTWNDIFPMSFSWSTGIAEFNKGIYTNGTINTAGRITAGEHIVLGTHARALYGTCSGGTKEWICGIETRDSVNSVRVGQGTLRTYIYTASKVYSNGDWYKTSDQRLKTNFSALDDRYLNMFDNLSPTLYNWSRSREDDNRKELGYVAQDVEQAMVKAGISLQENTIISKTGFQENPDDPYEPEVETYTLSYGSLGVITAYALKETRAVVQKHNSDIENLKETCLELKKENAILKAEIELLKQGAA
ncbi:MAG: phage tail spike protein [Lachnospiraceae bacterium]|nr:phage tail spike protein [Lachnospiraceae bacterium]